MEVVILLWEPILFKGTSSLSLIGGIMDHNACLNIKKKINYS